MIDEFENNEEKIKLNEMKQLIKELIENQEIMNKKIYNMEKFISENLLIVL